MSVPAAPPQCPTCGKRQWPVIHSCAGGPAARPAEPTGELREQVARWLLEVFGMGLTWDQDATPELQEIFLRRAGQMLSGPLAPLLARAAEAEAERDYWKAEAIELTSMVSPRAAALDAEP